MNHIIIMIIDDVTPTNSMSTTKEWSVGTAIICITEDTYYLAMKDVITLFNTV